MALALWSLLHFPSAVIQNLISMHEFYSMRIQFDKRSLPILLAIDSTDCPSTGPRAWWASLIFIPFSFPCASASHDWPTGTPPPGRQLELCLTRAAIGGSSSSVMIIGVWPSVFYPFGFLLLNKVVQSWWTTLLNILVSIKVVMKNYLTRNRKYKLWPTVVFNFLVVGVTTFSFEFDEKLSHKKS